MVKYITVALITITLGLIGFATVTVQPAQAATCTISKDSSAPVDVQLRNSTSTTATTASFSPPAGSMVAVAVSVTYDSNTTTGPTFTVKDSGNTSYTAGPSAYDGAASGTYLFTHYYTSAPGSITVKATRSGAHTASMFYVKTWVLDHAASSQTGAASASTHATSGTSLTHAITPTALNSWVLASVTIGSNQAATASNLTTDSSWQDSSDGSATANGHAATSSLTAETIGWTVGSSTFWAWAGLEILPATNCQAAPTATTNAATNITNTTATMSGTINPQGASTTYQFDYGTTTSYGTSVPVPAGSAGSGSSNVNESYNLSGLTHGTTYHYRIEATNSAGTTYGSDQQFTTTSTGLLTWSPPDCGGSDGLTCTDLNLSNTGSHQNPSLSNSVDYRIHLPSSGPLVGGLTISGGHNVQIIGGEVDLSYPCSDASSLCPGLYDVKTSAGEVYIEGVWVHNPNTIPSSCSPTGMPCSTGDGMDVDEQGTSSAHTIVLQNMLIDGISGCSGGSDHSDVFQPFDAMTSTIDIDHLTGITNCQGMTIDPDLAWGTYGVNPTYNIKNVNMDVTNNPYSGDNNRYVWWLTYNLACESGNITLSNDYAQEPDGTLASNSVWPDTATGGGPSGCLSSWSSPTLSFPSSPQISGTLTEGQPSGGDYVTSGGTEAGTGYVSPGYQ